MQTLVTSSPDTTSTLLITTLAPTPSTTRAFRLEQPSRGRTMIPQVKDNKSLTQIRTQQVDDNLNTYSKEARTAEVQAEGNRQLWHSFDFSSHTP